MNNNISLSGRMEALVSMITPGNTLVDIGCDHAYISIAAVARNISPRVLAMDVRKGPLDIADRNIKDYGLEGRIETRLSDGFNKFIEGEAQTAVIAGMGGMLIKDIIMADIDKVRSLDELILSPQSNIPEFRIFLSSNGFRIEDEIMVYDEDKYYIVMKVRNGEQHLSKEESIFGPILITKKDLIFDSYLENELKKNKDILCKLKQLSSDNGSQRVKEVSQMIVMLEELAANRGMAK